MEDAERQRIERLHQLLFPHEYGPRPQDPRRQSYEPYPTASSSDFGQGMWRLFPPTGRQPFSLAQTFQGSEVGMRNGFIHFGTPSSPLALNYPTSQAGLPRGNMFPPLVTPPFATSQYPFGSGHGAQYIGNPPPSDYSAPVPDAKEIKELLSNIRPDEDIDVDKDAVVPGLAPHVRLMKHQQASHFSTHLTSDGLGVDAKDGGQQQPRRSSGRRDGSR
jgi:hypothetical protein